MRSILAYWKLIAHWWWHFGAHLPYTIVGPDGPVLYACKCGRVFYSTGPEIEEAWAHMQGVSSEGKGE